MAGFRRTSFHDMIEIMAVPDTFACGLGAIDIIDCNMRFTYFARQGQDGGGAPQRVIVAKIVRPTCVVRPTWEQIAGVLRGEEVVSSNHPGVPLLM